MTADTRVTSCSPSASAVFGQSVTEILGQGLSGLLAPPGRDALDAALGTGTAWAGVLTAVLADGRTAPVHIQVEPLTCLDGPAQAAAFPGKVALVVGLPEGLPLGLGAAIFQAVRLTLPPGATLALYTDGLVESRSRPVDDGTESLRAALASARAAGRHLRHAHPAASPAR